MSTQTLTILLIEDNPDDVDLIQEFLTEWASAPFKLENVPRLSPGLERLARGGVDVTLLDLGLSDSQGLESLSRVQAAAPGVPIVVLTGLDDEATGTEAVRQGSQDYLVKGQVDGNLLWRSLGYAIQRKQIEDELRRHRDHLEERVVERTAELHKVNRAYRTLSASNQTVVRATDEGSLLAKICQIIVEMGGYRLAWVGFVEHDEEKTVRPVVWTGEEKAYINELKVVWAETGYGRSPSGTAIRTRQPVVVSHIPTDPDFEPWRAKALEYGYASAISLPLITDDEVLGVLSIYAAEPDAFDQHEVRLLEELGGDLAYGITALRTRAEREKAESAEREQRVLAEVLRDTTAVLASTLDPDDVMNRILDNVGRVVPHDAANMMLIEGETARVAHWRGYPADHDDFFKTIRFPLTTTNLEQMLATGLPVVIPDTALYPDWAPAPKAGWVRAYIGAPIRIHGQVVGFLNLDSATPGFFTATHVEHLQAFAHHAALAIENAQLYDEIRHHAAQLEQHVVERTLELQQTKERVETILNSSSDAIVFLGPDGSINQVNPAFGTMFGYEADEAFGKPFTMLAAPGYVEELQETLHTTMHAGQAERIELAALRQDGTTFDADVALSHVFLNERLLGLVYSFRDITERKQVEVVLRQTLEKEKELGELKSRFVSMASHEFRTPLTTITSSNYLLRHKQDRMTAEQITRHFNQIEAAVKNMTQLLEDVLLIGKVEAGRMEFVPAPIDFLGLCEDVKAAVTINLPENLEIAFSSSGSFAGAVMDEKLLRHILTNLLSNAIKYSPEGGVVAFDLQHVDDTAVIRVADQGIGIPVEDQARLFETFHRANNVGPIQGTGLGLAIIKNAIDIHGGTIHCESEEGVGTTFTVVLPTKSEGKGLNDQHDTGD